MKTRFCLVILAVMFAPLMGCGESDPNQPSTLRNPKNNPGSEATASISVTRGLATGTFTPLAVAETGLDFTSQVEPDHPLARLYHSVFASGGISIGDLDQDGFPDVVVTNGPQANRVFCQTGPFQFVDKTETMGLKTEDNPWSVSSSLADIDNDGDLDIYICNYESPNELWINNGKGEFSEMAKEWGVDVVDSSVMAYFGDTNQDGFLDLYLLTNRVYYEKGALTNFDINRDEKTGKHSLDEKYSRYFRIAQKSSGKLSLQYVGRDDYLFQNSGGKAFADVTRTSGIQGDGHGLSALMWDFDNDNDLDIYVANDFNDPDVLYENQGDGTFENVTQDSFKHTSWFSMGADFGDVNGDRRFDLMTVDMAGSSHYVSKVMMGDMNQFAQFLDTAEPRQAMRNFLHVNAGVAESPKGRERGGRFLESAQFSGIESSDWSWAPVFGDWDNDGQLDLFVTNGHIRNFNDPDFRLRAQQQLQENQHANEPPQDLTFWSQFRDEKPMLAKNRAFQNKGALKFEDSANKWGLDHEGMSYGVASGDLDLDGDLDLIVMNLNEPISVYRNDVSAENVLLVQLEGIRSNRFGVGAKVSIVTESGTQTRQLSPQRGFLSSHEPLIHFGMGSQSKVETLEVEWPSGTIQRVGGVEANQRLVLTEPDKGDSRESLENPVMFSSLSNISISPRKEKTFDDFQRQPLLPNKLSQLGPGVSIFDLNRDGKDDLYLTAPAWQAKAIALRNDTDLNSDSLFFRNLRIPIPVSREEMSSLFFDADGDGDKDVYIVCGGVEHNAEQTDRLTDYCLVNQGNNGLRQLPIDRVPDTQFSGSVVAAGDYDRDGDLDLFVGGRVVAGAYPTSPPSLLIRNETEQVDELNFVDVTESDATGLSEPGMVTSALWSDANGDGWIDLLLTLEWGPIKVYLNNNGKLEEASESCGLAKHTGWWNGITGRDFDNDGDIDYVVTNFGLNTKYSASMKKPARLYYGNFGENESPTMVEVKVADDCELPVRGKSCSQHAMPFLEDKFPTYHEFASSELFDIYDQDELKGADRFEATTLESCLLRNDGKGHFEVIPLPSLAQLAPGFGVVATDFNSDGFSDVFVAQNFFTAQRETGRMAGGMGVVLLGQADGSFKPLWPSESGVFIQGDAKSAAISDWNQDLRPDFVVGVNNDRPRFFKNQNKANTPICVLLEGGGKNPDAIGAKVTLVLDDGSTQSAEVYAGGGYLSQSTNQVFFGVPEGKKASKIKVRWADGSESEHSAERVNSQLEIRQPK